MRQITAGSFVAAFLVGWLSVVDGFATSFIRDNLKSAGLERDDPQLVAHAVEILQTGDDQHRRDVAWALGEIVWQGWRPPEALRPAIGPLKRALSKDPSPDVRQAAAASLGSIGVRLKAVADQLVPSLITALDDKAEAVRLHAGMSLGYLGPVARRAAPRLLRQFKKERDGYVRSMMAAALGEIKADTPEVAAALIEGLNDEDPEARKMSARSLGDIGPVTPDVVPALIHVLADAHADLEAWTALDKIGTPEAKEAVRKHRLSRP
jgi:HEAT repeat protein